MLNKDVKYELMYKPPGATEHQNITEVLDKIILRLESLTNRVQILEDEIYGKDLF